MFRNIGKTYLQVSHKMCIFSQEIWQRRAHTMSFISVAVYTEHKFYCRGVGRIKERYIIKFVCQSRGASDGGEAKSQREARSSV